MDLKPKPQTMRCLTIPRVQKFARPPTCRNSPMNETRVTQTPHCNPIYEAHIGGDKKWTRVSPDNAGTRTTAPTFVVYTLCNGEIDRDCPEISSRAS
ncbi:hypothetical protein F2Q69_00038601 [Brassica cretica]|uniref:Uncharacterized protein n=1 Tax=Brassica cretica TaxID=69181 RepID=A0A8S9SB63_BRACR|nr:hypothetical protein F2Q69_00038601 [Brassica cretica]